MVHLRYPTRDIFEVIFEVVETSDPLVVIAGHWPSRRQGKNTASRPAWPWPRTSPSWSGTMSGSSRRSTCSTRRPGTWLRYRPSSRRRC